MTSTAEKIISTSLFGNDRIIALSESKIYYEKTNLHLIQEENTSQEQIQLESLDCQDLKENFNAPITTSSNNRYSNKMQIADSYGNICILEKKTGNVKFYYKNETPVTDICNVTDSPSVFGVSDLGGSINLFDERMKTRIGFGGF